VVGKIGGTAVVLRKETLGRGLIEEKSLVDGLIGNL
jgi:hypothetical protein